MKGKEKELLMNLLMEKDVKSAIENNLSQLLSIIPEIRNMIGFEHKHPHHHLDVWEHTLLALSNAIEDFDVRLVLLLHDIGKPYCWQEDGEIRHFRGHQEVSSKMAEKILFRLGYEREYIGFVCCLIKLHDTPLTLEDIKENREFSKKLFEVQKCDCLAHNPLKNQKREEYIREVSQLLKNEAIK